MTITKYKHQWYQAFGKFKVTTLKGISWRKYHGHGATHQLAMLSALQDYQLVKSLQS